MILREKSRMSSSTIAMHAHPARAGSPIVRSMQVLPRLGLAVLALAGIGMQGALAQGTNRLEGIQVNGVTGNKVELTLRLSDPAPTPLTFTVDNPARIALDLPDTSVAMPSRRVDVKQG